LIQSRAHQGIKTEFHDGRGPRTRDGKSIVFETNEIFGFRGPDHP
jgi:hypothetical protein